MDGAVHRLTYATQKDEIMVDTGLEGDYYAMFFPDCVVVASSEWGSSDKNLYIYDWSFRLLDTVRVNVAQHTRTQDILIAETADRLILSDNTGSKPMYYIEKEDLGSGNLEVHEFDHL